MPSNRETRLGQLAIARGLVTLSELLRCVEESGREDRTLGDVLISTGTLSNAELAELEQRLDASGDRLEAELQRGTTMVLDELYRSRMDETSAATLGEGSVDDKLKMESLDLELRHEERYALKRELGRGGMGRVLLASDKILKRDVAMKSLIESARSDKGRERLLLEARVTGLLEHPSIVPVYDLRASRDGEPFYTMRVVQERSLEQILAELRDGATEPSLTNLVSILRQVSLAVQYAHDLGVVHRDLKPENVLVGKYGEVYVIDWGVAKIVNSDIGLEKTGNVVMGQLVGTPLYMAPEQARGDNEQVDERSDVYALGAILYELLTLKPMFEGDHVLAILFQVAHDEPPRPSERAPERVIPRELEEMCLRALRKDPDQRYQSAEEFADELELFLEGVKERERRRRMAREALEEAAQVRAIYEEVRALRVETLRELDRARRQTESWASFEEKKELWDLEQRVEDLSVEIERRFGETVRMYGQALVHVPQMAEARRALADLYWVRFEEAETTGNLANAAYFEGLVRQYNDGEYDLLLEGVARLSIETRPPGASVTLYQYQQVQRRLVEWRVAELGPTPVTDVEVSHGSHVVEIKADGYRSVMAPVLVRRGRSSNLQTQLYGTQQIPDDFVLIPASDYISGSADTPTTQYLDDFAIMKHPVTVGEYLTFLNELVDQDPEQAAAHAPRVKDSGPYLPRNEEGYFYLPETDPGGDAWDMRWPVIMINYYDASAYADWRSDRDGRTYRLPTIEEWEKSARGVDGRVYPWGDHFDAAFCLMRESTRGRSTPAPVGTFGIDRSPYGVVDMAGNVAEWTCSEEPGSDGVMLLGGAAYNSIAVMCRLDFHQSSPPDFPFSHYGFRLVMPLDSE